MGDAVASIKGRSDPKTRQDASWKGYVERAAQGDQTALASLYDESSKLVYAIALRLLGQAADAEEVTLDVYSQVWRTAATYRSERGSVTAWLTTLARSRALDRARSRVSRARFEEPMIGGTEMKAEADEASPEMTTAAAQRRRHVLSALATLSPEQREAVQLAFFSDLTHSELAEKLRQPLGTVKTRIRLGMMKLREQLEHLS